MGFADQKTPTWMGMSIKNLSLGTLTVQFSTYILVLHYSRVMPTEDGHRYLPSTAVFLVELLKMVLCLTICLYQVSRSIPRSMPATSIFNATAHAIFSGDSWKMAIPAGLFTLANSLQYVGITNLDAATFQVVFQLKILVTAICSVIILRRTINAKQWIALVLLMAGVAIVTLAQEGDAPLASSHHTRVYTPRAATLKRDDLGVEAAGRRLMKRSATYEGIAEDELALSEQPVDFYAGLLGVIGVCVSSGVGSVYFEKVIKDSPKSTSLWIRNVQISLYSLFPAFFIGVIFLDGENVAKYGFFDGYNWVVVLSIVVQAIGGVVSTMCIYYADNISKGFAIALSIVLSALASFVFFDFNASANFLVGTAMVLFATYLYSMQGQRSQPNPPVRIHNYESTTNGSIAEQKDISITLPKTPLKIEEALTTSRPGSPTHKKRKSDQLGYFSKVQD